MSSRVDVLAFTLTVHFLGNDFLRDIENRGKETKGSAFDINDDEDQDKEEAKEQQAKETGKSKKKQELEKQKVMSLESVMVDWIKACGGQYLWATLLTLTTAMCVQAALKEWERHLEARSDEVKVRRSQSSPMPTLLRLLTH
jgi:hypothetical protein